jgi:hypothetical protein
MRYLQRVVYILVNLKGSKGLCLVLDGFFNDPDHFFFTKRLGQ